MLANPTGPLWRHHGLAIDLRAHTGAPRPLARGEPGRQARRKAEAKLKANICMVGAD
jgi:hypothetical protein